MPHSPFQVIRQLDARRAVARSQNRSEYARKLSSTILALEREGAALGAQMALRRRDAGEGDYADAHARREEIERRRKDVYM